MGLEETLETSGELMNRSRSGGMGAIEQKRAATKDSGCNLRVFRYVAARRHFEMEEGLGSLLNALRDQMRLRGGVALVDEDFQPGNVASRQVLDQGVSVGDRGRLGSRHDEHDVACFEELPHLAGCVPAPVSIPEIPCPSNSASWRMTSACTEAGQLDNSARPLAPGRTSTPSGPGSTISLTFRTADHVREIPVAVQAAQKIDVSQTEIAIDETSPPPRVETGQLPD